MNEYMTIEEIEKQFDSEWVALDEPKVDEKQHVHGGTLLFHSKDRDEMDRRLLELRPKRCAVLYKLCLLWRRMASCGGPAVRPACLQPERLRAQVILRQVTSAPTSQY